MPAAATAELLLTYKRRGIFSGVCSRFGVMWKHLLCYSTASVFALALFDHICRKNVRRLELR
ncbi:hypothetical protein HMPREF1573_01369 [Gardnerella vaginalis JCP7276]|nr:hypothetical protein HMPREF1573_01369 [Gardnerella vaginalis JCP7276]